MPVTMMVALLTFETLCEATQKGTDSNCVMSLKAAKAVNLNTSQRLNYIGKVFAEMFVRMMVALLALETLHEATPIHSKPFKF